MKIHFPIVLGIIALLLSYSVEGAFVCKECQKLADDLLAGIEGNQTYEYIETELDNICEALLSGNPIFLKECKNIVDSLVTDLESLGMFLGKGWSGYALCTMLNICDYYCCLMPYRPEQVHIAVTGDPTEMVVNFVTGEIITPTVQWGTQDCNPPGGPPGEVIVESCNFTYSAVGTSKTYTNAAWQGWLHTIVLTGLEPSTTYWYRVGDPEWDWSTHNFNFTSAPLLGSETDPGEYTIVAYGDMGASDVSDINIFQLNSLAQASEIDMILHAGDISYANGFQYVWDDYMRKIEFFAAYVPYMTAVGNHELFYNFTAFKNRFSMPGEQSLSDTNMYFSFNYGPAHIIAYSFEQDAGVAPEMHPGGIEYNWLEQDLIWASNPANRTTYPWVIMYGHRPFYCSNSGSSVIACDVEASYYRSWIEPLIQKYHVDFVITAHIHDYERTYPVYNNTVTSTSYDNPTSAAYVVVGTGGNREGNTPTDPDDIKDNPWTASINSDIGFGIMKLTNSSLNWQFFSSYQNLVVDEFTITKN